MQNRPNNDEPVARSLSGTAPFRKIVTGMVSFLLICFVAVACYMSAGWSIDDAVYMVVITIFGVGYGEVQPITSPALRSLTIAVIIAGYASVIYTVGGFMQMLIDGELNKALGARKMCKEIDRLHDHTIICGMGRLGSILAQELDEAGKPFVAIDADESRLQDLRHRGFLVIHGDATEEEVLENAGIRRAATVAAVLSEDAVNVFVTITAREMNSEIWIIARGENPRTERKLISSGANKVVLPTAVGAQKFAHLIIRPTAENMLEQIQQQSNMIDDLDHIGLHFDELIVRPDSELINREIGEIEIRSNHGFLIVGIRKADGTNQLNPPPTSRLQVGDVVVVLGHLEDIPELARRFSAKKSVMQYRGVTMPS